MKGVWWIMAAAAPLAWAQSGAISDYETHFIRGLAQRQDAQLKLDQMALQKGSTEAVKAFAQSDIDVHTEGRDSIIEVGKSVNAWGPGGVGPPPPGAMRGPPRPPPAGAPAAAAPRRPGPPPPGLKDLFTEALNGASGADFDRLYLFVSILQDEEMLRTLDLEIETASSSPKLVDWSKAHREAFRRQARHLQKLLRGEDDSIDNPLERERGTAAQ